ncbi:hypothetical protein R69619_03731 [Paraburkholderia nemoris]|uniref:Bpu10I family restriction endonuclease n=1 Tax=Paraburkholderia nemoris TaxID=2793076 RepID=UPI00190C90B9|nr:Bpu10I family restriction endonuclease [Paraburkholderia nemoris]MBK3743144.1 Bpu10I family restriction endonuclease [Paraburkholderia aspalathi]CAE6768519.1 hypothetical protein R69619_03731 [Paraburkholderia nemoris]
MSISPPQTHAVWQAALQSKANANMAPHCQNLLHQCSPKSAAHNKSFFALSVIVPKYLELVEILENFDPSNIKKSTATATKKFDEYMKVLREAENDVFSSVSDFKTSAAPEFFLRMFHSMIHYHKATMLEVSGQRDIPVEMSFDIRTDDFILARTQRVDAAIIVKTSLTVGGTELAGFCVPIFAAEIKTYFDKNMISGVDYSAAGMKSTFPHCLYYSIGEFADFDIGAHSYASGAIDEIFILRHQKRSDFRKTKKADALDPTLICEILENVERAIIDHQEKRPHLNVRMKSGKLIG